MSAELPQAIDTALADTPEAGRVVLLGDTAHAHGPAMTARRPDLHIVCPRPDVMPALATQHDRYDLGILSDLQAWEDRPTLDQQIAALRDLLCKQFLVSVTQGSGVAFTRADSLALGLKQAPTEYGKSVARNWYKYSIIHYKRAPDWLNSDNWAHPERWNTERW